MKNRLFFLALIFIAAIFPACSQNNEQMQDGYYTAESSAYDVYGWKVFITIYISNNRITTVEYNAKNASGFSKTWDVEWMRKMKETVGTYPNKYIRAYADDLLNKQDPFKVNAIPGTGYSHDWFRLLAAAAIEQAKKGDKKIAFVDLPGLNGEEK